jgi:hypothetical protein
MNKYCLSLFFIVLIVFFRIQAQENLDDLEEANPQINQEKPNGLGNQESSRVQSENSSIKTDIETGADHKYKDEKNYELRTRGYFLLEAEETINAFLPITNSSVSKTEKIYFPNFQMSLSSELKTDNRKYYFIDGVASYRDLGKKSDIFINQIGFRGFIFENWQWAIGKERNRKAPGMLISPSDILFSLTNLPGQKEDRKGIWLSRISFQDMERSYNFNILPVSNEESNGWPIGKQDSVGFSLSVFQQYTNIDTNFTIGKINNTNKAGFAIQELIKNIYKIYTEIGYQEYSNLVYSLNKKNLVQGLLGLSYEASKDYTIKMEYLYNGQGLSQGEFKKFNAPIMNLFLRQNYLLTYIIVPEIRDRYNLMATSIIALEDTARLHLVRGEYIENDNLLLGLSVLSIFGDSRSQYRSRNIDRQFNLDVKYAF